MKKKIFLTSLILSLLIIFLTQPSVLALPIFNESFEDGSIDATWADWGASNLTANNTKNINGTWSGYVLNGAVNNWEYDYFYFTNQTQNFTISFQTNETTTGVNQRPFIHIVDNDEAHWWSQAGVDRITIWCDGDWSLFIGVGYDSFGYNCTSGDPYVHVITMYNNSGDWNFAYKINGLLVGDGNESFGNLDQPDGFAFGMRDKNEGGIIDNILICTGTWNTSCLTAGGGGDAQAPSVVNNAPANYSIVHNLTPTFNFTYIDETEINGSCVIQANGTNISGTSYAQNNTITTLISNTSLSNFSWYFWNASCTDVNNTNESIAWMLFVSTCSENWTAYYTSCNTSDQRVKLYNDTNGCGSYFDLPADNGTNSSCNYCNESLEQQLTECINGTQNVSYVDNNFVMCCFVTNITSDCSVLYTPPYNETNQQNCSNSDLINNFTCYVDENPILTDKINVVCVMPDNQTYCCVDNIYQGINLLATTPEYQDASESLLAFRSEEESRVCFTPSSRLVNTYYTTKNLRTDTRFILQVLCTSNNGTSIKSEYYIIPTYEKPDFVFNRMIWVKENAWALVGALFILIVIASLMGYLYKRYKSGI